jgi:hypothetical protein
LSEVNAEMLAHVGSEKGFEEQTEATKYYQRNIRMYSQILNEINLTENDRVLFFWVASHYHLSKNFISRSQKIQNSGEYLQDT